MISSKHIEEIKFAIKSDSVCELRSFLAEDELPSWEECIMAIEEASKSKAKFVVNKPMTEYQINNAVRRGVGYFYAFPGVDDRYVVPKMEPVVKQLQAEELPFEVATVLINLFTEDEYATKHKDEMTHNLYIQGDGTTYWSFFGANEEIVDPVHQCRLTKGDALCFSGNIYHSVNAETPRNSVVLQIPRERFDS